MAASAVPIFKAFAFTLYIDTEKRHVYLFTTATTGLCSMTLIAHLAGLYSYFTLQNAIKANEDAFILQPY